MNLSAVNIRIVSKKVSGKSVAGKKEPGIVFSRRLPHLFLGLAVSCVNAVCSGATLTFPVVDTNQTMCVDNDKILSSCPERGADGFGQDAQYEGLAPSYTNNGDGTVADNNSRLIWAQTIDINGDGVISVADKLSYDDAIDYASNLRLADFSDWRIPTIKELYSLMMFDGEDPSGINGKGKYSFIPFIDHSYFSFDSGDMKAGERLIDSQYLSSTKYVSTTMKGDETVFGVNFIDGRIKGYGMTSPRGGEKTFYVLVVRGNTDYGINHFIDNGNNTIIDKSTGLTWQQNDSGMSMDWSAALAYCENLTLAGNSNWRLPNAKELQSIVDYSRSPDTTSSAAIDPRFSVTSIVNEAGKIDYPNYWSSTTHLNSKNAKNGVYVAFGRSMGNAQGQGWVDVHGAGSQRSDPKEGDASQYANGHGPQGDAIRISNSARCVTGGANFIQEPGTVRREAKVYILTGHEASMSAATVLPANDGLPTLGGDVSNGWRAGRGSSRRPERGRGGDPFTIMDENGDGKLSRSEVKGPLADDFDRIDRNGDGYIIESELPQRPQR